MTDDATCSNCGERIIVKDRFWNLEKLGVRSVLSDLNKIMKCCKHPSYWCSRRGIEPKKIRKMSKSEENRFIAHLL